MALSGRKEQVAVLVGVCFACLLVYSLYISRQEGALIEVHNTSTTHADSSRSASSPSSSPASSGGARVTSASTSSPTGSPSAASSFSSSAAPPTPRSFDPVLFPPPSESFPPVPTPPAQLPLPPAQREIHIILQYHPYSSEEREAEVRRCIAANLALKGVVTRVHFLNEGVYNMREIFSNATVGITEVHAHTHAPNTPSLVMPQAAR